MSGKKKPSGSFYKKRKAELDEEDKKLAKTFQKFLKTSTSTEPVPTVSTASNNVCVSIDKSLHSKINNNN